MRPKHCSIYIDHRGIRSCQRTIIHHDHTSSNNVSLPTKRLTTFQQNICFLLNSIEYTLGMASQHNMGLMNMYIRRELKMEETAGDSTKGAKNKMEKSTFWSCMRSAWIWDV